MDVLLRVLYLTHHGPWPAASGGRVRDAALVAEVARRADVELWAVSRTAAADRAWLSRRPPGMTVCVYPDEAPRRGFPTRDSGAARRALRKRMGGEAPFDVIHVEGHYLFHLVPEPARHRTVVVEHNVESHLLRQRAAHEGLSPALAADLEEVARAEERVWRTAGLTLTLSTEDRDRIVRRVPTARVHASTNGVDHLPLVPPRRRPDAAGSAPRIGFLANYGYPPNRDALRWLLDEIMPAIRERLPGCRLVLAGSNLDVVGLPDPLPPDVTAMGWVDDPATFWDAIDLMVCPLRVGGGIKVKVTEAIRSGTLAVSTTVGLEGLPPAAREAIVRADTAPEFADAVARLVLDPRLRDAQRARLARAQRSLPGWASVADSVYRHWLTVGGAARQGTSPPAAATG